MHDWTKDFIQTHETADLPESLMHVDSPPERLYVRTGKPDAFTDIMRRKRIAIVGSRTMTPYGEDVTDKLASELAAQGIVIVSGLALGIDSVAHRAALRAKGTTMAVLPTCVSSIYPRSHLRLAGELLDEGGALVSEYATERLAFKQNFVARNRIVAGLADALLITEAAEKSGTMHTARFALKQGIDVLAVPGDINNPMSEGTNNLIKSGATPITKTADVLYALNMEASDAAQSPRERVRGSNDEEQLVLDLLEQGVYQGSELLERSGLDIEEFNHHLTMLEITAKIRPLGANNWALR